MTKMVECQDCEGTGKVGRFGWFFGSLFGTNTCPTCRGVGSVPEGTNFGTHTTQMPVTIAIP